MEPSKLLSDPDDPQREAYLQRFADQEGRRYLGRFYNDYRGLTPRRGAGPAGAPHAAGRRDGWPSYF